MNKLLKRVAFEFDVLSDDLIGSSKHKASTARKVLVYFLNEKKSRKEIQSKLELTPTEIYNAISYVRDKMAVDEKFKLKIKSIKRDGY